MFTKSQLDQFQKLLESNNKKIIKDIHQEIKNTEQSLRQEIQSSAQQVEEKLSKKIYNAQEETIDAVSDITNTGFNIHEIRIKRIEEHLDLPPIKQ